MRVHVNAVVANTKGVRFTVKGFMWGDGSIFVHNPKPEKYPDYKGLLAIKGSRQLFWTTDATEQNAPSKFVIYSIMLAPTPKKKTTTGKNTRRM